MGDGVLVPGEIIIHNVDRGVDSNDGGFRILENENLGREVKFFRDGYGVVDRVCENSKGLYIPGLVAPSQDFMFMLAPQFYDFVSFGMGLVLMKLNPSHDRARRKHKSYLAHSTVFHEEEGQFKYKMMVNLGEAKFDGTRLCQAVVSNVHKRNALTRYIDADFLAYSESYLDRKNKESIDFILENESLTVWDIIGKLGLEGVIKRADVKGVCAESAVATAHVLH